MKHKKRKTSPVKCFNCGKPIKPQGKNDCYCEECRPACRKKDVEDINNMTDATTSILLAAVLERAKADYIKDVKKWRKAYTCKSKRAAWGVLVAWSRWWKKDCFDLTTGIIDGKAAMQSIHREIYGKDK